MNRWLSFLKHSVVYDRSLSAKVAAAEASRSGAIPLNRDLDFMKVLHNIFPPAPSTMRYDDSSLLARARERFQFLQSSGIDLKGLELLDLGSGHGENLWLLDEMKFKSVTGVDYTDDRYQSHLSSLPVALSSRIRFLSDDLMVWEPPRRSFDLVVSINSFEHFPDPKRILEKCQLALRSGGVFFAQFGPLFRSPFGPHRQGYSSVPYIQNLFEDDIAFDFFYQFLKINEGVNRYTGKPIKGKDPYPEVNRWSSKQFQDLFQQQASWEVLRFENRFTYRYAWFVKIFRRHLVGYSHEDLYASEIRVILRKR